MICTDSVYGSKSSNAKVTNARGKGKSGIRKLLEWHKYHKWYFPRTKDILKERMENTDCIFKILGCIEAMALLSFGATK